jgi:tetratricopeptide (TPR) repeat protein
MSRRRLLVYIAIYLSGGLALVGVGVFVAGIIIELQANRAPEQLTFSELSPAIQLALAGLGLAALMLLFWFGLVALLIARQARERGSGYGDAYRLIENFRFNEAIPLLERSIREGKENQDVLMLLTSAYAYTGQFGKAQATADRAVQLFPNDPGAYVTLANGYRLHAAYDEAAAALKEAVERDPDQPILWAELGFVQLLAGDETAAFDSFKCAAGFPMSAMYGVRVHYHLAQGYQQQGDAAQAMKSMARMMSARDGLAVWKSGLDALEGTVYGQALYYEIEAIERALSEADAGNLG